MATEAILNIVWVLLCVGALSYHFWRDRRRAGSRTRALRWQRAISVVVAAVALFPVISASDDRLRLADLYSASPPQQASLDRGKVDHSLLSPSLEDPEHGQTTGPRLIFELLIAWFLVAPPKTLLLIRWFAFLCLGRAPPSCPAQA